MQGRCCLALTDHAAANTLALDVRHEILDGRVHAAVVKRLPFSQ